MLLEHQLYILSNEKCATLVCTGHNIRQGKSSIYKTECLLIRITKPVIDGMHLTYELLFKSVKYWTRLSLICERMVPVNVAATSPNKHDAIGWSPSAFLPLFMFCYYLVVAVCWQPLLLHFGLKMPRRPCRRFNLWRSWSHAWHSSLHPS